jgi:endonuclease YncB( thermonuclease family)
MTSIRSATAAGLALGLALGAPASRATAQEFGPAPALCAGPVHWIDGDTYAIACAAGSTETIRPALIPDVLTIDAPEPRYAADAVGRPGWADCEQEAWLGADIRAMAQTLDGAHGMVDRNAGRDRYGRILGDWPILLRAGADAELPAPIGGATLALANGWAAMLRHGERVDWCAETGR